MMTFAQFVDISCKITGHYHVAITGTENLKFNIINYATVSTYLSEHDSEDGMGPTTDIIHVGGSCRPADDRIKLNLASTTNKFKTLQQCGVN